MNWFRFVLVLLVAQISVGARDWLGDPVVDGRTDRDILATLRVSRSN